MPPFATNCAGHMRGCVTREPSARAVGPRRWDLFRGADPQDRVTAPTGTYLNAYWPLLLTLFLPGRIVPDRCVVGSAELFGALEPPGDWRLRAGGAVFSRLVSRACARSRTRGIGLRIR